MRRRVVACLRGIGVPDHRPIRMRHLQIHEWTISPQISSRSEPSAIKTPICPGALPCRGDRMDRMGRSREPPPGGCHVSGSDRRATRASAGPRKRQTSGHVRQRTTLAEVLTGRQTFAQHAEARGKPGSTVICQSLRHSLWLYYTRCWLKTRYLSTHLKKNSNKIELVAQLARFSAIFYCINYYHMFIVMLMISVITLFLQEALEGAPIRLMFGVDRDGCLSCTSNCVMGASMVDRCQTIDRRADRQCIDRKFSVGTGFIPA